MQSRATISWVCRIHPQKSGSLDLVPSLSIKNENGIELSYSSTLKNAPVDKRKELFRYSIVLSPSITQEQMYKQIGEARVSDLLYRNSCVFFIYGTEQSKKSHLISGERNNDGFLYKCMQQLIALINQKNSLLPRNCGSKLSVKFSMFGVSPSRSIDFLDNSKEKSQFSESNPVAFKEVLLSAFIQFLTQFQNGERLRSNYNANSKRDAYNTVYRIQLFQMVGTAETLLSTLDLVECCDWDSSRRGKEACLRELQETLLSMRQLPSGKENSLRGVLQRHLSSSTVSLIHTIHNSITDLDVTAAALASLEDIKAQLTPDLATKASTAGSKRPQPLQLAADSVVRPIARVPSPSPRQPGPPKSQVAPPKPTSPRKPVVTQKDLPRVNHSILPGSTVDLSSLPLCAECRRHSNEIEMIIREKVVGEMRIRLGKKEEKERMVRAEYANGQRSVEEQMKCIMNGRLDSEHFDEEESRMLLQLYERETESLATMNESLHRQLETAKREKGRMLRELGEKKAEILQLNSIISLLKKSRRSFASPVPSEETLPRLNHPPTSSKSSRSPSPNPSPKASPIASPRQAPTPLITPSPIKQTSKMLFTPIPSSQRSPPPIPKQPSKSLNASMSSPSSPLPPKPPKPPYSSVSPASSPTPPKTPPSSTDASPSRQAPSPPKSSVFYAIDTLRESFYNDAPTPTVHQTPWGPLNQKTAAAPAVQKPNKPLQQLNHELIFEDSDSDSVLTCLTDKHGKVVNQKKAGVATNQNHKELDEYDLLSDIMRESILQRIVDSCSDIK